MGDPSGECGERLERVEAARVALYRRGATEADRLAHAALVADLGVTAARGEAERDPDRAVEPEPATGRGATPIVRRRRWVAAGLAAAVSTALVVLVHTDPPAHRPGPIDPFRGPLARVLAEQPALLPAAWRGARTVASSDSLDGATPIADSARGEQLLVVRCVAPDRSFQAVSVTARGRWIAYGSCGRLQALTLPSSAGGSVVVTTRGVSPFSAALLVRGA